MRIVCEIRGTPPLPDPIGLSRLLLSKGIKNECEETILPSGETLFRIWVLDEDEVVHAKALFEQYRDHPEEFKGIEPPPPAPPVQPPSQHDESKLSSPFSIGGPISTVILALVSLLFIFSVLNRPASVIPPKIEGVKEAPRLSPLEQALLFDYPHYFALRDELLKIYTPEEIKEGKAPSYAAKSLMREMEKTPFWNGLYDRAVDHIADKKVPLAYEGPLFEKIKEGECWRFFTPALLHYDFLHIFFNVLWFLVLAGQIEKRIGSFRFLLLLLLAAIVSNTAQYIMSGPFFLGLSGLVCAMAAFIWAREQTAPWEGYLLHRMTIIFLLIFVFGIFGLQLTFFFTQIFLGIKLQMPIANTAHIIGGVVGYLLGRLKYFSLKKKS